MKPKVSRIAAYALVHDSGRLLLCRLSREVPRWTGYWRLPGGGIDFGESPEQTVIREVEEETGYRVKVGALATIDTLHDSSGTVDFHGIRIIYHARSSAASSATRSPAPPTSASGIPSTPRPPSRWWRSRNWASA